MTLHPHCRHLAFHLASHLASHLACHQVGGCSPATVTGKENLESIGSGPALYVCTAC